MRDVFKKRSPKYNGINSPGAIVENCFFDFISYSPRWLRSRDENLMQRQAGWLPAFRAAHNHGHACLIRS